ncbi:hypothetical protein PPTG_03398 [Phytophthora nicotianae INRA-310]|uniref:HAT C-terminal dimerisation domain-containing protein n=1 Tax=Phytophthora nicotianae (strain INRA-310) TaxID=761204 RepID=W2R561_PHYN3|nr:hypothetical protein PPTG_03398 [Phytophthora nicotianae INRA-310]ETN20376.1 hypothetical protein PPTG_03398 [Phytophthora nicotianae INRA-310]
MSEASLMPSQRSQSSFTPKQIAEFYFKPYLTEDGDPTGLQVCKACGKTRKHVPRTGYTNLVSHVKAAHPRFELEMEDASIAATGSLLPWVRQKASNRYAWLEWVISANLPLSFVEMESTRRYTKLPPVCRNTLRANMEGVTKAVEIKIGNEMPDKFGLLLDGWTHGTEHYLGVFACYETPSGPQYPLLSLAPIVVDAAGRFDAETHMAALAAFLPYFGKDLSNCIFLVGDNCAVNKRLARLMGIPLVGCASHRLNLAVRTLLEPHEADLEQVQSLMKRLRTLTQAAKLRLKTSLKPKLRQETRWGSTYAMLARYFALREFISADDEDLADLMPSPAANRRLKALLLELADVESVSMKLQSEDLNLLDARDLLDGLLEFESAVIKVLGGRAKLLSRAEKAALKPFERKTAEAADVTEKTAKVGFADRILKRRKVQEDKSAYSQLNAIPPTSNAAERLFSMARMVLRYERNRLSPLMLEMLLFLKLNSKYWDVTMVDAVI